MASLSPSQRALRARFEGAIGLAAPFLDVILGVGERISRIAEPTDHEYYPIRPGGGEARLPEQVDAAEAGDTQGDAAG